MSTTTISDACRDLVDLCNRVVSGRERIIIEHHSGRVALVPVADLDLIEEMEDGVDRLALDKALKEAEEQGTIPWEELKAELES
jgi:prevent-host-death family protein